MAAVVLQRIKKAAFKLFGGKIQIYTSVNAQKVTSLTSYKKVPITAQITQTKDKQSNKDM